MADMGAINENKMAGAADISKGLRSKIIIARCVHWVPRNRCFAVIAEIHGHAGTHGV